MFLCGLKLNGADILLLLDILTENYKSWNPTCLPCVSNDSVFNNIQLVLKDSGQRISNDVIKLTIF